MCYLHMKPLLIKKKKKQELAGIGNLFSSTFVVAYTLFFFIRISMQKFEEYFKNKPEAEFWKRI